MNNGKLTVTNVASLIDISASTKIRLENTGDYDICVGFGDLDASFSFGEGVLIQPGEVYELTSSDALWGDGTFYAITKSTPASEKSALTYAADGGVSPVITWAASVADGDDDVAITEDIVVTANNTLDDGVASLAYLIDVTGDAIEAGTVTVTGKTLTFAPTSDLANSNNYILFFHLVDANGREKTGKIDFTTVAA